ncbi:MAG: signal transduction histidine kinase, partial [Maribacter sp.]
LKNERLDELVKLAKQNEGLTLLNLIASHDLRSPIHSLLSLFAFIDYDEIKNKETLEILKSIEMEVKSVENSLDNYLNIMSINTLANAALEEVILDHSLSVAVNSIGSLIQNSNTTISFDFSSFPSVYFNKVYMQSIF